MTKVTAYTEPTKERQEVGVTTSDKVSGQKRVPPVTVSKILQAVTWVGRR